MSRPTTKQELILAASGQFERMWKLVDALTQEERNASFDFGGQSNQKEAHWKRDRNLRDVYVHLYEWHQLLLNWVDANRDGVRKPFLPEPYNWKTYGKMNEEFWEKHQSTPCDAAREMLLGSHKKVMDMIEALSDEELFEKKHFPWTGTSSLGAYCVSATSSHYDWAMKKIKAHKKAYQQTRKKSD